LPTGKLLCFLLETQAAHLYTSVCKEKQQKEKKKATVVRRYGFNWENNKGSLSKLFSCLGTN
jgi:hypothetical protein